MTRRVFACSIGALIVMAGLAGCSADHTPTGTAGLVTDQQQQADLAASVANASDENVSLLSADLNDEQSGGSGSGDIARGLHLARFGKWAGGSCTLSDHVRTCTGFTWSGLALTRTREFFDGQGAPEDTFDVPNPTDSAQFTSLVTGNWADSSGGGSWTGGVHRQRWHTLTGIQNADSSRFWNGRGERNDTLTFTGNTVSRTYVVNDSSVTANVEMKVPLSLNPYPLSGTVTHYVNVLRTREGNVTVSKQRSYVAVVQFNGTYLVPVTVGENGHYCLDLVNHRLAPPGTTCQ